MERYKIDVCYDVNNLAVFEYSKVENYEKAVEYVEPLAERVVEPRFFMRTKKDFSMAMLECMKLLAKENV